MHRALGRHVQGPFLPPSWPFFPKQLPAVLLSCLCGARASSPAPTLNYRWLSRRSLAAAPLRPAPFLPVSQGSLTGRKPHGLRRSNTQARATWRASVELGNLELSGPSGSSCSGAPSCASGKGRSGPYCLGCPARVLLRHQRLFSPDPGTLPVLSLGSNKALWVLSRAISSLSPLC